MKRTGSEYSNSSRDEASVKRLVEDVTNEQKKRARGHIYGILFRHWKCYLALIFSAYAGCAPIINVSIFGKTLNSFYAGDADTTLKTFERACIKMGIVGFAGGFSRFVHSILWIRLGAYLSTEIRRKLFASMMKGDVEFFDVTPIGSILTMLSEDSQILQDVFGNTKGVQIQNLSQFLSGVISLFVFRWELGLVLVGSLPVIFLISQRFLPGIELSTKLKFLGVSKSMTIAEEALSSIRTVKGFNNEEYELQKFVTATKLGAKHESMVGVKMTLMGMTMLLILWAVVLSNLYFGATMVDKGYKGSKRYENFEVGELLSCFSFMIFGCLGLLQFQNSLSNEQKGLAAGARILEMTDYKPSVPYDKGIELNNFAGKIEFRNVTFRYPSREVNVLKNVSFVINPGQIGALVGHSGSGKSTCVQLLERFYDRTEGEILLDGVNIKEINPRWLHRKIALVSQEPLLFQATVKENICYGTDVGENVDRIVEAAKAANAYKFIEKLPNSFDEMVGERGGTLSGGQRQRIAIARAVIKDPVIMITDEATSALDADSEKKVQVALDKVMENRTGVVVAHRLSTIKGAHILYVFDAGVIVEHGTHNELVAKKGAYYNLVKRQMTDADKDRYADAVYDSS